MSVTLREIAERSGVSPQAVSRILGGHVERFRPETCRRVERVARELNYRPDPIGRALVRGRTMSVGVLIHGLGGRILMTRTQELLTVADNCGYETYMKLTGRGASDTQRMIEAVQSLVDRRVDGLIVFRSTPISDDARRYFESLSVPMVFIDRGPPRHKARIVFRRQPAIDQLAEHLATLGHRRAVLFASIGSADFREHKIHPYQRAFARAGVELAVVYEQWPGGTKDFAAYSGINAERRSYDAVRRFLAGVGAAGERATVFCMNNDESAIGAMAAIREAGMSVPRDVGLVGFDDLGLSQFCEPPLTTIRTPRDEVGRLAFEMLERLMRDPDADVTPVTLPFELVLRESVGPVSQPHRHVVQ